MADLLIPCPKCGSTLKLRDRSLLGKRGKCPKCGHGFLLQEPDEVELELAEAAPVLGQAAQWVPDDAPVRPAARGATAVVPDFAAVGPIAAPPPASSYRELRKRNARRQRTTLIVGAVVVLLIGGSILAVKPLLDQGTAQAERDRTSLAPGEREPAPPEPQDDEPVPTVQSVTSAADLSPTKGTPIPLRHIPGGATVLVHLHPAQLWAEVDQVTELRYALNALGAYPLVDWAAGKIKEVCLYEPHEIEEALISISVLAQDMEPEIAAVVRLKAPIIPGDLITKRIPNSSPQYPVDGGPKVYVSTDVACIQHDERTLLTMTPGRQALILAESYDQDGIPDPAIEAIMEQTDRDRHLTVIFPPEHVRIYQENLFPAPVRPLVNRACLWLGDDVEAVAWSLHVGTEQFFSQFVLRNRTVGSGDVVVRPERLAQETRQRLDLLPGDLYAATLKMEPKPGGPRKLIGRFPAMMKAYSMGTVTTTGERDVTLTTILPERAAPNLALGALLAWDESTRTDFNREVTIPSAQPALPETVAGRLQVPLDVEFRKTPLEEALRYIFDEIKLDFEIDGDGLKSAGFTKNMEQNYELGTVAASEALKTILAKYEKERDPIVIVFDEEKKSAYVTVKSVAVERGLTPHEFK